MNALQRAVAIVNGVMGPCSVEQGCPTRAPWLQGGALFEHLSRAIERTEARGDLRIASVMRKELAVREAVLPLGFDVEFYRSAVFLLPIRKQSGDACGAAMASQQSLLPA